MVNDENNFLRRRSYRSSELGDALLVGRGKHHAEDKSESQLSRVRSKNQEYCQLFGLPETEELVEEYNCALQRKILLQGKMYVFSSYVCFYSNVFGYITKRSLALKEVTSVSKAKNVGFPNSIKIVHKGKQMFFTSFLSREDAFRLIIALWYESSPYARLSGILPVNEISSPKYSSSKGSPEADRGNQEEAFSNGAHPSETDSPVKAHRKTLSNEAEVIHSDGLVSHNHSPRSVGSPISPAMLRTSLSAEGKKLSSRVSKLERRHSISELKIKSSKILELPASGDAGNEAHKSRRRYSRGSSSEGINLENFSTDDDDPVPLSGDYEAAEENETGGKDEEGRSNRKRRNFFLGTIVSESPPSISGDMELLCEAEFPISAYHFFATFLSDKSSFLKDFHQEQGDKNVIFTQWKQMDAKFPGYMRNMTFSSPLGFSIGPESTHCDQTQRYSFYQYESTAGEEELALVYETSQINTDVPYGDYFRVCTRWDIVDTSKHDKSVANDEDIEQYTNHTSAFRVYLSVPFSKSTIMNGTIVQKTKAQCREFYEKFISAVNKRIYALMERKMMATGIEGDKDLSSRIPAEWRQQIKLMLNLEDEDSGQTTPKEPFSTFYSFTGNAGNTSNDSQDQLSVKRVLGTSASLLLKALAWILRQLYRNSTSFLLICSLALNILVLCVLFSKPDYVGGPMGGGGPSSDMFWKARRASLAKETKLLKQYLALLKSHPVLTESK